MNKIRTYSLATILISCLSFILNAQNVNERKPEVYQDAVNRVGTTPPNNVSGKQDNNSGSTTASDAGAQRPVFLKTDALSLFAGYDAKITYRSNPLTLDGDLKQAKTGIWQNSFYGGGSLNPIDTSIAVVTPYFGGSWTMSDYLNDNLSSLNDYASSAYGLLMIQHESGVGLRGGVSYANVRNNDTDSEDYSEFYPNIGAMKTYSIDADTIAIVDVSGGFHLTKADPLLGSNTQTLNSWDAAFSYGIRHNYWKLVISPNYRLTYKKYTEGGTINDGRKDVSHTLSIKIELPIIENATIGVNTAYTRRNSSGGGNDYKSLDAGAIIGINVRF